MKKLIKITALIFMVCAMGVSIGSAISFENYGSSPSVAYALTLKQGSSGERVKTMQTKLKRWGYYTGSVDGIFGAKTRSAVVLFQKKNKLTPDGIVGAKTLKALGMSASNSTTGSQNTTTYSDADVALLTRLIYGEARGESYVGQVAIGAVVMNRIRSSSFPNTLSGVVYQKYAFTAVADGQINLTPNATARKAALDAMNGWDPTYGAIYYYNPATATSAWIFSRQTIVTIGNHVFAK